MGKREAILERIATFILAEGVEAATLRAMAAAAGQSDRMLLYYFKDKDEMIAAALDAMAEEFLQRLDAAAVDRPLRKDALHEALDQVMLSNRHWPYLRLWIDLAGRAARGDVLSLPVAERIGGGFHAWIEGQLVTSNTDQRRKEATEIMIGLQGVLVLKAVGMQALVDELM